MAEFNVDVLLSLLGDQDVKTRLQDVVGTLDSLGGRGAADIVGSPDQIERGAAGMERLGNAANILVGAVGVILASGAIGEFFALWQESNKFEATAGAFERMSAGLGGANAVLPILREGLQGMVDDEAIMSAFNTLPGNISLSATQIGDMLNTARVLGGEGAESVKDFADAFAGRSWDRLRDFGVDVDQTKDRVEELTDAGMDIQEAFDQAVWETMADTAERLGPALDSMVDPMTLIAVQAQNIKDTALDAFFSTMDEGIVTASQLFQLPGLLAQADAARQGRIDSATDGGRIEQLIALFNNADSSAVSQLGGEQATLNMEALARAAAVFAEDNGRGVQSVEELEAAFGRTFGLVNFQFDDATARMANFYIGWMFQQEQMELRMQILARDGEQDNVANTGIPGLGDMSTGAVPAGIAATETSVAFSREQVEAMAERLETIEVGELAATLVIDNVRFAASGWQQFGQLVEDKILELMPRATRDNGGVVPGTDVRSNPR